MVRPHRCQQPDVPGAGVLVAEVDPGERDGRRLSGGEPGPDSWCRPGQAPTQSPPRHARELEALTEAMPPRYRLLVQLAAWCALRFGELTELRRGDVDTRAGVIRVRRAVVLVDGRFVIKEPRSEAGIRE